MKNPAQLLPRLNEALPVGRAWINWVVAEHYPIAKPIESLGFKRLPSYFPAAVLEESRVVTVRHIPFPPIVKYGLTNFASLEDMPKAAVTYTNLVFLHESLASESVLFHELVHVLQWKTLGLDAFVLTYAVSTLMHGYAHNPLEAMAFDLQSDFDRSLSIPDLARRVCDNAERARAVVADAFRQNRLVMGGS